MTDATAALLRSQEEVKRSARDAAEDTTSDKKTEVPEEVEDPEEATVELHAEIVRARPVAQVCIRLAL